MTQTPAIPFRTKSVDVTESQHQHAESWTAETTMLQLQQGDTQSGSFTTSGQRLQSEQNTIDGAYETQRSEEIEPGSTTLLSPERRDDLSENEALPLETSQTKPAPSIPDIESANDMELRLSNDFFPIKEDNWDTVLYIGPPLQQHGVSTADYDHIQKHFSRPYLMRSQTLRESGSSEFVRRLGPMSARVARKLKNLGLHQDLPSDGTPKYWIDLRPMQNDEEALLTVAELTCTPGVLTWHQNDAARGVDPLVIKGKDALNTPRGILENFKLPPDFFSKNAAAALKSGSEKAVCRPEESNTDLESDYSPLRHHTALERLLHAIAGNTPKLNSAPKMWTFFAVARIFDCATHPRVSSEIYTWLFSGANSNFIVANPEVCYRIAMGTQSKMLLRVVFCILVGEKALDQARVQGPTRSSSSPTVVPSRPLTHLDDDELNRIDHAARSLSLRIHKKFRDMMEYPINWITKCTEVFKLFALVGLTEEKQEIINSAIKLLFQHVRTDSLRHLAQNLYQGEGAAIVPDSVAYGKMRSFPSGAASRYNALTLPQRLLSQISWTYIKTYIKESGATQWEMPLRSLGTAQWDGLDDICQSWPGLNPQTTEFAFAKKIEIINKLIANGQIHYHNVHSHKDHLGDYEIRWDALFAAVCRNTTTNLEATMSEAERHASKDAAERRESIHRQRVLQYEQNRANVSQNDGWGTNDLSTRRQQLLHTADEHYTSACIDSDALSFQAATALSTIIEADILRPGYLEDASGIEADINVDEIETLLCLDENEFKFLPLWADGCDDGTGGVFTDTVPGAIDEDFLGGTRGLGPDDDDGLDGLDDVEMGDSFSVIDAREAESTVAGASKVATAGYGTDSVMSLDE